MNKAFVRESDVDADRCPQCGSAGKPVTATTLDAWIRPEQRGNVGSSGWFCPFPRCEVTYFDNFERFVTAEALVGPVFPKSFEAPVCACFGLTLDDIEHDLDEGTPRRIREILEKSKTPAARCSHSAADGTSCIAEIQRLYMKRQQERNR